MRDFEIQPLPPYRLDLTVCVLRRLNVNAMDLWDGETYRRVLALDDSAVEIGVRQTGKTHSPRLRVELSANVPARIQNEIGETLTKLLGTGIDLAPFERLVGSDPKLAEIAGRFAGFKPPRYATLFETLANGIACQQISLSAGLQLLNRFCARFGLEHAGRHAFPRPCDLLSASVEDLRALGFSGRKAKNILAVARAIDGGMLSFNEIAALDDDAAVARLRNIPGLGRWTAQYVMLRGLGRLDVYPADDVGSQNRFQRWWNLETRPDYDAIQSIVGRWRPYRGLIYFYLLLDDRARQGVIGGMP